MSWTPIGCARSDEIKAAEDLWVVASRSDIGGEFGEPRIDTIWGDPTTQQEVLKDVRHPRYEWESKQGDREPCEHYEWTAQ